MRVVSGSFMMPASDIDKYFGIGFVPDWVRVVNPDANQQFVFWTIHMMRHATALAGWEIDDDGAMTENTPIG